MASLWSRMVNFRVWSGIPRLWSKTLEGNRSGVPRVSDPRGPRAYEPRRGLFHPVNFFFVQFRLGLFCLCFPKGYLILVFGKVEPNWEGLA